MSSSNYTRKLKASPTLPESNSHNMARAKERDVEAVEVDEITLDGKRIRVRNVELPLGLVRLDPTNPRIAHTFAIERAGDAASQEKRIEERLWSDPDVRDLLRQVEINH